MVIIFLLLANFYGSTAFPYRSEGIFGNPASLGFSPGFEFIMDMPDNDSLPQYLGAQLGFYGIGITKTGDDYTYHYATGLKVGSGTFVGVGISRATNISFRAGFIKRFKSFLTINAYGDFSNSTRLLSGGLGLRLLRGVVRLYSRVDYTDSLEDYGGGLIFQPIKGLSFTFDANKDGELGVGVRLFISNFGFGYRARGKNMRYTAILSARPYSSHINLKRRRRVEIVLDGKYPEIRKYRFLSYSPAFYDLVRKFRAIVDDKSTSEVLIKIRNPRLTYNQAEELRSLVEKMRFKGKKVYFFASVYTPITYYLASAGTKVFIQTMGEVMIPGFQATKVYFLPLMKKLGIEAEFYHIKEYKSAIEPLTRSNISKYDSLQTMVLLHDFMKEFVNKVAKGRNMSADSVRFLVDSIGFFNSDLALKYGLVDKIVHETDIGGKKFVQYRVVETVDEGWEKPVVAVLTAEGSIVNGKSKNGILGSTIGSESMVKIIRRLREDKNVKAVVFRINSGGGDAIASEAMWQELMKLKKDKPLVVSMGWLAASGGYYISSPGTKIYADNTTITGSIGILGGKLVFKDFAKKIGINTKILASDPLAAAYSPFKKLSTEEMDILKRELQHGYDKFISRVSETRGISKDSVNAIGRGRVWSGMRASKIGLVDKIGGLDDAIREAVKLAGIKGDYKLVVYPQKKMGLPKSGIGINEYMNLLTSPYLYMMPYWMEVK